MSQQDNQERTNQAIKIEDVTVEESRQDEVKGGDGGIQKVGCGHLILPNGGNYSGDAGVGVLKSTDGGRTW